MNSNDDLAAIEWIASDGGRQLLQHIVAQHRPLSPAAIARVRDQHGRAVARWVAVFASQHAKAEEKLGPGLWMTTERAVQQATDRLTAAYKARRFPADRLVHDLCCGIGGDAVALANRAAALVAVDADACIAAMAAANLHANRKPATPSATAQVVCGDAVSLAPPTGGILHIDPDRRPGEQRTSDPAHYLPPWTDLQRMIAAAEGAAVKLAPAAQLAAPWVDVAEREWISVAGRVRQQVAWFGCLRSEADDAHGAAANRRFAGGGLRRATRLSASGEACSFAAPESEAMVAVPIQQRCESVLIDFDPAIRAAGLSSAFARHLELAAVDGPAGYFTAATPPPANRLLQRFEVLWQGAADVRGLRRRQRELGVRIGTIKVRGGDQQPAALLRQLADARSADAPQAVLLISRIAGRTLAIIARSLDAAKKGV